MSLQIIEMKVADLVPYAMNAKQHPAEQVAQIAASIEEFGMNDPVAVWHDADGVLSQSRRVRVDSWQCSTSSGSERR